MMVEGKINQQHIQLMRWEYWLKRYAYKFNLTNILHFEFKMFIKLMQAKQWFNLVYLMGNVEQIREKVFERDATPDRHLFGRSFFAGKVEKDLQDVSSG